VKREECLQCLRSKCLQSKQASGFPAGYSNNESGGAKSASLSGCTPGRMPPKLRCP
jgi:hypothetical protein